jgi:hypothetical protein
MTSCHKFKFLFVWCFDTAELVLGFSAVLGTDYKID